MPLKKTGHSMSHSAMPCTFRTIIKSRVNNQIVKELVQLSAALQSTIDQDDKRSVKSSASMKLKTDIINSGTDKLKNFVRNMKESKQKDAHPTTVKIPRTLQYKDLSNSRTSLCSVRSTKSNAQNFFSIHIEKDILDNKSIISTKSLADSECLSRSKLFQTKFNEDSNKQKMMDKLNKIQEKIDYLVKNKLKNLCMKTKSSSRFNPKPFFGSGASPRAAEPKQQEDLIEKQFETLIGVVYRLKQRQSQESLTLSQLEQGISELDKKILLLQKILASNSTQADILRKFYFAQKSQKYAHLSRKDKIVQEISKRKQLLKTNSSMIEMRQVSKKAPMIRYESTSKFFFAKPQKSAYVNLNDRSNKYIPNTQPFPRSSYGRQFLNYGTLPVFNYKPHDSKHSSSKLHFTTSNYSEAFKEKHMDLKQINYKQLDCFKDKFKTGSISFAEMYNNKGLKKQQGNSKSRKQGKQKENSVQKAMNTLNSMQSSTLYDSKIKFMGSTQMKRQFIYHSTEKNSFNDGDKQESRTLARPSVMKNAQLNSLKASFRMQLIR